MPSSRNAPPSFPDGTTPADARAAACDVGARSDLRFSIVIPTRDRPRQLAQCLERICELEFPRERFEVIVVDDGGSADLSDLPDRFGERITLAVIAQPHRGPAAARNLGAQFAAAPFLVFVDDDCSPTPGLLAAFARHFDASPDRLIGGRIVNALPENPYSTASQLLVDYLYEYFGRRSSDAMFFTSNNCAVASSLFRALGGFDAGFPLAAAEDRDFCDRWQRSGRALAFAADAVSYHAHPLTAVRFWKLHFKYGRGAIYLHRARLQRGQGGVRVESPGFYLGMFRYPFRGERPGRALALAVAIFVSQVAHSCGCFWELQRGRWLHLRRAWQKAPAPPRDTAASVKSDRR